MGRVGDGAGTWGVWGKGEKDADPPAVDLDDYVWERVFEGVEVGDLDVKLGGKASWNFEGGDGGDDSGACGDSGKVVVDVEDGDEVEAGVVDEVWGGVGVEVGDGDAPPVGDVVEDLCGGDGQDGGGPVGDGKPVDVEVARVSLAGPPGDEDVVGDGVGAELCDEECRGDGVALIGLSDKERGGGDVDGGAGEGARACKVVADELDGGADSPKVGKSGKDKVCVSVLVDV